MNVVDIWVYLAQTPLLWLTVTLLVYSAAQWLFMKSGALPLVNPVLLSITALVAVLLVTGTPYDTYFEGAQFVHFLLGPATVALALPLYNQLGKVRSRLLPLTLALFAGSATGILSPIFLAQWFGLGERTVLSLAPKSVTTPIAMGVAEQIGGAPPLTAVLVILTGIIGASLGVEVLRFLRLRDGAVQGFAIGTASHGIGTARALQVSEEAGAFSGLAMGLNGALTALLVPLLIRLLGF